MNILGNSRSNNNIINKANSSDFKDFAREVGNSPKNYFSDTNWTEMLRNSSVRAISQIGFSNSAFTKALRAAVFIVALFGCCYRIYGFLMIYFQYPVLFNLKIGQRPYAHFPSVTVCNLNRMKSQYEFCLYNEKILFCDTKFSKYTWAIELPERRNYFSCSNKLNENQFNKSKDKMEFFKKYFELDAKDKYEFGHKALQMVESCSFSGTQCKHHESSSSSYYGNCFTFNNIDSQNKIMIARSTGPFGGLEFIFNIEPREYASITQAIGMRIDIHGQRDLPFPGENGITILPGYETDISLSEIITSRLPKPFKDECISYVSKQSQSMCLGVCLQKYNYAKCGCVEPLFPEIEHRKICNITKVSDVCCLDSVLEDLTQGADCNCPSPCLSTHFSKQISMAIWPSQNSFFKGNQNASFEDLKLYRSSHAKVRIYYKTFERKIFEQKPMFHPSELFSYLGGECALWLGLSLTAFLELVELLFYLGNTIICKICMPVFKRHI